MKLYVLPGVFTLLPHLLTAKALVCEAAHALSLKSIILFSPSQTLCSVSKISISILHSPHVTVIYAVFAHEHEHEISITTDRPAMLKVKFISDLSTTEIFWVCGELCVWIPVLASGMLSLGLCELGFERWGCYLTLLTTGKETKTERGERDADKIPANLLPKCQRPLCSPSEPSLMLLLLLLQGVPRRTGAPCDTEREEVLEVEEEEGVSYKSLPVLTLHHSRFRPPRGGAAL
ncbi:hypothetical protein INR49_029958 [Caranx melampygus]|nr:hypothetical protein INR49_029958 [Caranx melampygus]